MKSPLPLLSERALGGGVNEGGGEREDGRVETNCSKERDPGDRERGMQLSFHASGMCVHVYTHTHTHTHTHLFASF